MTNHIKVCNSVSETLKMFTFFLVFLVEIFPTKYLLFIYSVKYSRDKQKHKTVYIK